MRARILTMLLGFAVVAAACGGGGGETVVASGEAIVAPLAYEYVGGEQVTYRFDGSVDMTMTMDGSGAMGADAGMGDMDMGVDISGDVTMTTADGEEPGTTELTILFDVADLTVRELTMGGEEIPAGAEGFVDQSGFEFPETTIVVDSQGNIVSMSVDGEELPAAFGAMGGAVGPAGTGLDPAIFLNPSFPEGDLTVGSEWETAESVELPGMGTLTTRTTNRVTETVAKQGHDLFHVESVTTMAPLELDLFEMMAEMAAADPATAEGFADAGAFFPEGMEMRMSMVPGEVKGDTWFDATSGMVASASLEMPLDMTIEMNVPGEGSAKIDAAMEMSFNLTFVDRSRTA